MCNERGKEGLSSTESRPVGETFSASLYPVNIFGRDPSEDLAQPFDMLLDAEFSGFPLCTLPELPMEHGVNEALCYGSG